MRRGRLTSHCLLGGYLLINVLLLAVPLIFKHLYAVYPTQMMSLGMLEDSSKCRSFLASHLPATIVIICLIWPFLYFHCTDFCNSNGAEIVSKIPFQRYIIQAITQRFVCQVSAQTCKQNSGNFRFSSYRACIHM